MMTASIYVMTSVRDLDDDKFRYELLEQCYFSAIDGDNGDSTDNVYYVRQKIQDITFENGRIKWAIKKKTQNHERRNLLNNGRHAETTMKTKQLLTAVTQLSQQKQLHYSHYFANVLTF